jgi:hypothetical protein
MDAIDHCAVHVGLWLLHIGRISHVRSACVLAARCVAWAAFAANSDYFTVSTYHIADYQGRGGQCGKDAGPMGVSAARMRTVEG